MILMNLADKLNILMKKNNIKNPKELSEKLNEKDLKIPYTTLLTIINNEVQDIKLGTAKKLCILFNLTLDELLDDNISIEDNTKNSLDIIDTSDLTKEELEELERYKEFLKSKRNK